MIKKLACSIVMMGCSAMSFAEPTLISPMIDGMRICESAINDPALSNAVEAWSRCMQRKESAASLIDRTLSEIGPQVSPDGRFELGYTLGMPLLSYITFEGADVAVRRELIRQDLRVISQSNRSLVLYLFSNHFIGADQAETAKAIAEDADSLMQFSDGSVPIDNYFASSIYPWSLGNEHSLIDKTRKIAMEAVLEEVCRLPESDREKIHAVTALGEIHHFFPNFMNGMGYGETYEITDYSQHSQQRFRRWLQKRYASIEELNAELSSRFSSFEEIVPPSKNIASESLSNFFEHIDAHAHGVIPFHGWAYDENGQRFSINVYLNGQFIGAAETDLTRLDVAQAIEGLNDSNVGYRYDLDFSTLPPGIHQVELRFVSDGKTSLLKTYKLVVVDRSQSTPQPVPAYQLLEVSGQSPESLHFWADYPKSTTAVFYNPLARLWNEFRQVQVREEVEHYADLIGKSCVAHEKIFSHQIGSGFNASWNPNLLATSESLEPNPHYAQGVNLYGGIIYGDYFFRWLDEHGHTRYGVPEMHPMTPQSPQALSAALRRHHKQGAVFLSPYFISIQPGRFGADPEHDRFKVSADNAEYGSSQYYEALRLIMNEPIDSAKVN